MDEEGGSIIHNMGPRSAPVATTGGDAGRVKQTPTQGIPMCQRIFSTCLLPAPCNPRKAPETYFFCSPAAMQCI